MDLTNWSCHHILISIVSLPVSDTNTLSSLTLSTNCHWMQLTSTCRHVSWFDESSGYKERLVYQHVASPTRSLFKFRCPMHYHNTMKYNLLFQCTYLSPFLCSQAIETQMYADKSFVRNNTAITSQSYRSMYRHPLRSLTKFRKWI